MRRLLIFSAMFLLCAGSFADTYRYRLYLTDKKGSEYCALSDRAMERRERQGIALDSTDLEVSPVYLDSIVTSGFRIVTKSRWLNSVVIERPDGKPISRSVINEFGFVDGFERVGGGENISLTVARGKYNAESQLRASSIVSASDKAPVTEVCGEALFNAGHFGAGMLITVLDGGFSRARDLESINRNVIGWYDMYDPEGLTNDMFEDEDHGTECLSVMSADSTYGVWGAAPEAEYFLIRTEYSPTESPLEEDMWVAGAEMADSIGSDLISSSLGYFTFDDSRLNHSQDQLTTGTVFISRGAAVAVTKGMLVCCSAGNDRQTAWGTINFPADVPDVFTVGATDSSLRLSYFSSPGFTQPYVKPDVCCRGSSVPAISPWSGSVTYVSGTSFSCPLMCGLCASLWSAAPELTPAQIRDIVRQSASKYAEPDSLFGYGLPDFSVALQTALELTGRTGETYISAARPFDAHGQADRGMYVDLMGRRIAEPGQNKAVLMQKGGKKVLLLP